MKNKDDFSKEAIIEPLEGAINYLDQVFLNKELISDALDDENYQKAWEEFENLILGIETLNELLNNIKNLLGLNYKELEYEDKKINSYIEDFNVFLKDDLMIAMENKDYVLVSDLINYELQTYLKEYQKIFIFLLDYVNKMKIS